MVLNLHDQAGRRKTKWIATHLPVPGNRKRAEELLFQTRHQYADSKGESGLLFADYMLQWLGIMKAKVSPTTYTGYRNLVENSICPYFWERRITLAGLRASDVQRYYDDLLASGVSGNTILHHHANIHKALKDAVRLDLVDRNVPILWSGQRKYLISRGTTHWRRQMNCWTSSGGTGSGCP